MKGQLFLFIIFTLSICDGHTVFFNYLELDPDKIEWKDSYQLNFEDFSAISDSNSKLKGLSAVGIEMNYLKKNDTVEIKLNTIFYKKESWIKIKSQDLLNHEQLHFDICEIYSRRIKSIFYKLDKANLKNKEKVDSIFDANFELLIGTQNKYDKETSHSLNQLKQKRWTDSINLELKKTKYYYNMRIKYLK